MNKPMTTKEKAQLMASYEPGQKWQSQLRNTLYTERWYDVPGEPEWNHADFIYRRKPEPVMRPWRSIDEVPLDHWFKPKKDHGIWTKPDHVWASNDTVYVCIRSVSCPIVTLLRDYEHSPKPFGDPLPCGVVVE